MNSSECRPLCVKRKKKSRLPRITLENFILFHIWGKGYFSEFHLYGKEEEDLNYVQTIDGRIFSGFMLNQIFNSCTTHNRLKHVPVKSLPFLNK